MNTPRRPELYHIVSVYLNSLTSIEDFDFTNLFTGKKSNDIVLSLDTNRVIDDDFLSVRVCWINKRKSLNRNTLVLKVRKSDKRQILCSYLQHIHFVFDEIEQQRKDLRLHINVREIHMDNGDDYYNHNNNDKTIGLESDGGDRFPFRTLQVLKLWQWKLISRTESKLIWSHL